MSAINLSRIHYPVTTLGPGKRIGIWFQGCSIRCAGCISTDTWSKNKGATTIEDVMSLIHPWVDLASGVTISGGEPFDQPHALYELLRHLSETFSGDVLVYTGYHFEEITSWVKEFDGLIDALISEPFENNQPQTLPLRGSDNQQLHLLTSIGRRQFYRYIYPQNKTDNALDVMFDEDGSVWFAGIPQQNDFNRLRLMLESQGHEIATSEQRLSLKEES